MRIKFEYPYLWKREHDAKETEGRKPRETAVAVRLARAESDALMLLAIASRVAAAFLKVIKWTTRVDRTA